MKYIKSTISVETGLETVSKTSRKLYILPIISIFEYDL